MRISQAFEFRHNGGPKPTWRVVPAIIPRGHGSPIRLTMRRVTNKRAKRLQFAGDNLRPY